MRATNLKNLFTVSFLIVAVLYMAAPARADVDINASVGLECDVIISFDARSEPNLPRAFSLDIRADNDANIVDVTLLSSDYIIFPGTIQIDAQGNVTDYGSPVAPQSDLPGGTLPGIDSNGITIELASLYSPVGPGSPNAPDPCAPLVSVTVDKSCTLTITANVPRAGSSGVVMESPDEAVTVNLPALPGIFVTCDDCGCYCGRPDYDLWVLLGRPECWCYSRQCRGDIDGKKYGPFWVQILDLNIFKTAFNKTDAALPPNGVCADLDHIKYGPFRVNVVDLDIFKQYFNKLEDQVPECPIYFPLP